MSHHLAAIPAFLGRRTGASVECCVSRSLRQLALVMLCVCGSQLTSSPARGEEDDDEPVAAANTRQVRLSEQSFDQMVFGGTQQQTVRQADGRVQVMSLSVASANSLDFRKRMEALANAEIRTVDQTVSLTEAQKKKLQLAARGDIAQHVSRAAELRPKLTSRPLDQAEYTELMRQTYPLRMAQQYGLFGDNSLFRKTLRRTLTDEQNVRLKTLERERQAAIIEAALQNMERVANGLKLSGETRRKFAEVLLEHGDVPQTVGPYGQHIVLLEANLLRDHLKPLLSAAEWEKFESQVVLAKRFEPTLELYGFWTARRSPNNEDSDAETKD